MKKFEDKNKYKVYNWAYNELIPDELIGFRRNLDGSIYCSFEDKKGMRWNKTLRDYELMQCIGLKDKNGKLIYEGDILQETYEDDDKLCKDYTLVEYRVKSAGFVMYRPDKPNDVTHFDEVDLENEDFKIVGNIYKNPDLIFKYFGVKE